MVLGIPFSGSAYKHVCIFRLIACFGLVIAPKLRHDETMKKTKLYIYSYMDYRLFINDRLDELKADNAKFSRRYFCSKLGLASTNYLKLIIDGRRNLSDKLLIRMAQVLGLDEEESAFFADLVAYGQAKNTEAKLLALENLRKNKRFIKVHQLALDNFDYFADPVTLTMRELVALRDFREDPEWIAQRMPVKATARQIQESLDKLERLGQIARAEDGSLAVVHRHQSTGSQLGSVTLRSYHLKMLQLAAEAMELPVDTRHYRGLTMSIPGVAYDKIIEQISLCINRIRAIVDESTDATQVYHLEMALFPLTRGSGVGVGGAGGSA